MTTLAAERTEVHIDMTTQNDSGDRVHGEGASGDADVVVLDHAAATRDRDDEDGIGAEVPRSSGDDGGAVAVEVAEETLADPAVEDGYGLRNGVHDEADPATAVDPVTRELVIDDLLDDADPVPFAAATIVAAAPAAAVAASAQSTAAVAPGFVDAPLRSQVRAARRLQARKVARLVRHIELYSLLKVSLLFYTCMLVVGVVAGVLLWSLLQKSGAVSSVEGFVGEIFLLENFHLEGRQIFRIGVLGGMVGVLVLTLVTLIGGLLFNLISDLTGGIRVSVVELESARPVPSRQRRR